jgi:hypothetical protein
MCSLRQDRRRDVPCFSTSHSPPPPSFKPVLSTSEYSGGRNRSAGAAASPACSAAQRRVVWHGEVKPRQSDDGVDQPLGLPQRRAKDCAQRQCRGDRQGRVVPLTPGVVRGSARHACTVSSVNCRATIKVRIILPHPGMLPNGSGHASPECSRHGVILSIGVSRSIAFRYCVTDECARRGAPRLRGHGSPPGGGGLLSCFFVRLKAGRFFAPA